MKIVLSSILENISTRSDGSVKLTLGTQEMDESNAASLFGLRNKFVKVLISDSNITPLEEKLIDETKILDGKKVKTKSQRLRAVFFKLHQQEGGTEENFDAFYDEKMERLIEQIKSKLE
jgi:hypothetical protein